MAILLAVVSSAGIWQRYRGLVESGLFQLIDSGFEETLNVASCLSYWVHFLALLEKDQQTGRWDFPVEAGALVDFHRGDFQAAVAALEIGERTVRQEFWLALSLLRLAEERNCLFEATTASESTTCVLPISRTYRHAEEVERAIEMLSGLTGGSRSENDLRRWLLGYSAAASGHRTQARERLGPRGRAFLDFFDRDTSPQLVFADQATELGVATYNAGKGVAVEDFDQDGDLDLVTGGSFDSLTFYANQLAEVGAAEFVDRTKGSGLEGAAQAHIMTAADFDNDRRVDLFVGRLFHPPLLMRNVGGGVFEDVTDRLGFAGGDEAALSWTWGSAWGDVDNDGDLDLFLARWGVAVPGSKGPMAGDRKDSMLLINDEGGFRDATRSWGLEPALRDGAFNDAAFGDVDNDGDLDLFVSSIMRRRSVLFENRGGEGMQVRDRGSPGFMAAMLDVDHDGRIEIFQGGLADARTSVSNVVFGRRVGGSTSGRTLIASVAEDGTLRPIEDFFQDEMAIGTMGASFGDLDNDGCVDFYLGTGGPEPWFVLPNLLYQGVREGGRCVLHAANVSHLLGFATVQKGHGVVFFDFDSDGDQDIYSSLGGMWPADRWPNQLFVNQSDLDRSWLKIRLRGRRTNSFGIGARIRVEAVDRSGHRITRRAIMNNKTGFGSSPYIAHFGLLNAARVDWVEVQWPTSGCTATYEVELKQLAVLDEDRCWSQSSDQLRAVPATAGFGAD